MADESSPGIAERMVDKMNEWASEQPQFTGQVEAMWREGLKDLQNAILPAFPESQRGVEEPGTPLSPTSQQVTQELGVSYDQMLESYAPPSTPVMQKEAEMER
ncbi:hypothetical protein [Paludisphaera mucosa]|uniref:Uncharacterized protein n=1 Tax=Paludisphaera mucosa TaxID=3030827 RepID=A0ABT6FGB9_9BACT|nr:hypothetical protein [Paludisphaera mucosa]MDG3006445.1 hypothetical protein [Paludisphaera mucosa]